MLKLRLSTMPDGLGYIYGHYHDDNGEHLLRVDILLPANQPRPPGVMKNECADPEPLIIYADGEEIGRVKHRGDIKALLDQQRIDAP
jgi:hypothetical protein